MKLSDKQVQQLAGHVDEIRASHTRLVSTRDADQLWERHIGQCLLLARALPADVSVADFGSGAGLPGITIGIARPDLHIHLWERTQKKARFCEDVAAAVGLENVSVHAEDVAHIRSPATADVVVSRAVGPFARIIPLMSRLSGPSGELWCVKGDAWESDWAESLELLPELQLGQDLLQLSGSPLADVPRGTSGLDDPHVAISAKVIRVLPLPR